MSSSNNNDPETRPFYQPPPHFVKWQNEQGIPIHETIHVDDLMQVELGHWDWIGGPGAFVNLGETHIVNSIIIEIPPGGKLKPVKHLFETWVYIVDGQGETVLEQEGFPTQTVSWQSRSLFGPPINTRYQHINTDSEKPARILMLANAPLTMNLFHDDSFVFENPFVFESRYKGEDRFFEPVVDYLGGRIARINFIPDVLNFDLLEWKRRGVGAKSFHLSMSDHTIAAHVSEFAPGTYKKCHRHGPSAHVIILAGEGYSLLWADGDEPTRVDWKPNSMFTPPDNWWHQHFNTGPEPARYLALRMGGSPEHELRVGETDGTTKDITFAPEQIEYEDEPEWIYDLYISELDKKGLEARQERPNYRKAQK